MRMRTAGVGRDAQSLPKAVFSGREICSCSLAAMPVMQWPHTTL